MTVLLPFTTDFAGLFRWRQRRNSTSAALSHSIDAKSVASAMVQGGSSYAIAGSEVEHRVLPRAYSGGGGDRVPRFSVVVFFPLVPGKAKALQQRVGVAAPNCR